MDSRSKLIALAGGALILWWMGRKVTKAAESLTVRRPGQPMPLGPDGMGELIAGRVGYAGVIRPPRVPDGLGAAAVASAHRMRLPPIKHGVMLPVISPRAQDRRATTMPWYAADSEQINRPTPADPYALPAVGRFGDAVNPSTRSPLIVGTPDDVPRMADDEVDAPGVPGEYREPGDALYGEVLTTDYGLDVPSAYDPTPGVLLGARRTQ